MPYLDWLLAFGLLTSSQAAALKVDLSRSGRNDTAAPRFVEWQFDPPQPTKTFGEITLTLRAHGQTGRPVEGGLYKFGIDHGARVACDGLFMDGGGGLELVFTGLTPGRHSIATFHNWLWDEKTPAGAMDLFVNGRRELAQIQSSVQVTHDDDMASAFVEFEAKAGEEVVLCFTSNGAAAARRVVLNGFELDGADPRWRAKKPSPADGDEHVDGDRGAADLSWTAPTGAVSHHVYFGTNAQAVGRASTTSEEYKGRQAAPRFHASGLNHFDTYFWRVDEALAGGAVIRGEVWRFRTRHLAFPTAEGYGRFARGGRGGRVIAVTNLNDSGPGSLRAAIEAEGPRTVVFNVSGLITLESKLIIKNPYLTVAGQTAPAKGICIRKFNLGMMGARDVIVRHMRVRPGNLAGVTLDGMGMASSDHCIIDHCSISWSQDEGFSSRSAKNITLQRTLISEALNQAGHKKYPPGTQHGYAASIGGMIGSFHHNLLAHCAGRNWSLAGGLNQGGRHTGWLDLRNNVVYNWKHRTTDGGAAQVQFVNNYYKPGPASTYFQLLNPERTHIKVFGPQMYFVAGNIMEGRHSTSHALSGVTQPEPYENFILAQPIFEPHVKTDTAAQAYERVLADVGCNRPRIDDHDARVIDEVRKGAAQFRGSKTGLPGLPDSQEDVGGWEDYPEQHRPADWDIDGDGMPGFWETRAGLNPTDARDGGADRNGDGYTNLEEYLGWLTGEFPDPAPIVHKTAQ